MANIFAFPEGTPYACGRIASLPVFAVIAHGGAASSRDDSDGPQRACEAALASLGRGANALDAAVAGCVVLEDDPRFNAGTGSNLRLDGKTIEMDAAVMTSDGKFGAVACIRDVRNPVLVARDVHRTPHNLLAGDGAIAYARARGHPAFDVHTPEATRRYNEVRRILRLVKAQRRDGEGGDWDAQAIAGHWNYPQDLSLVLGSGDTVGVCVHDGTGYAAAISTGGTIATLLGRVGDVPLFGCGIYAGPRGAVSVTGAGDFLTRRILAANLYGLMESGLAPDEAITRGVGLFAPEVDVGAIVLFDGRGAAGGNRDMAWAEAAR